VYHIDGADGQSAGAEQRVPLADVPWLDRERQVVRERANLGKALQRVANQLPKGEGQRNVEMFAYQKMRDQIKDEAERTLLDEVVGKDGWLTSCRTLDWGSWGMG
jgi:hypothetical protein